MRYVLISHIFMLCFLTCSCSTLNRELGIPDDNIAEEVTEAVIYSQAGVNIDLTPESPENP